MARDLRIPVVMVISLALSWMTVAVRVYTRVIISKWFGIDDAFAILTLFIFTVLSGWIFYGVQQGFGVHASDLTTQQYMNGVRAYFVCELLYVLSTGLIKISLCFTFMRIFVQTTYLRIIYLIIAVESVFMIFYFFFILFTCSPVRFFWERILDPAGGTCKSPDKMVYATYAHGIVIALGDLTLGILPVFLVWNLHMNRRSKVTVVALLAFGSVAIVATVARIPRVQYLKDASDFLFANADIAIWSIIEVGISLIASSAATLRPLITKYHFFSSNSGEDIDLSTGMPYGHRYRGNNRGNVVGNDIKPLGAKGERQFRTQGFSAMSMGDSFERLASEVRIWDGKASTSGSTPD